MYVLPSRAGQPWTEITSPEAMLVLDQPRRERMEGELVSIFQSSCAPLGFVTMTSMMPCGLVKWYSFTVPFNVTSSFSELKNTAKEWWARATVGDENRHSAKAASRARRPIGLRITAYLLGQASRRRG